MNDDNNLSRAWRRSSAEEPPLRLDDAIRAAARAEASACSERAAGATARRPQRLWWPLAVAATLATVIIGILQVIPRDEVVPTAAPPAPPAAPMPQAETRIAQRAPPPTVDRAKPGAVTSAPAETSPPPAPAPPRKSASTVERRPPAPTSPATAIARAERQGTPDASLSSSAAPPSPTDAPKVAAAAPPHDQAASGTIPAPAPATAAAPAPDAFPAKPSAALGATGDTLAERSTRAGAPPRTAARMASPAPPGVERSFPDWVAQITKLLREERTDEAKRELARLRERYPGREADLPAELKALIEPR